MRDPLVSAIAVLQQKNANLQSLDADEFDLLKELLEILKPFELITTEFSAEKYVSGSKTLIMLRELKQFSKQRIKQARFTDHRKNIVRGPEREILNSGT